MKTHKTIPNIVCPICKNKGGVAQSRICAHNFLCMKCGRGGKWADITGIKLSKTEDNCK